MGELAPKSFWLLVLIHLQYWFKISGLDLLLIPNYWTWTKVTPQKSGFSSQIFISEVMITSLIDMLELPNFGHMTKLTI